MVSAQALSFCLLLRMCHQVGRKANFILTCCCSHMLIKGRIPAHRSLQVHAGLAAFMQLLRLPKGESLPDDASWQACHHQYENCLHDTWRAQIGQVRMQIHQLPVTIGPAKWMLVGLHTSCRRPDALRVVKSGFEGGVCRPTNRHACNCLDKAIVDCPSRPCKLPHCRQLGLHLLMSQMALIAHDDH